MKRFALLLGVLLAAGCFTATVFADSTPPPTTTTTPLAGLVPAGVTLAGISIGGLAPDVAAQTVTDAFGRSATLRFQTTTVEVSPSLLGLAVPVESAIAKALTVAPNTTLTLRATVNGLLVRSFIANIADRFDRGPVSSRLLFRNSKPFVTPPVIGRTIQQSVGVRELSDELVHGTRSMIVLQAKLTNPPVMPNDIGPVIVIERGSDELLLYTGMKFVQQFQVATDQNINPTPLGLFKIAVMWKNPWWYPPASNGQGQKPVPPGSGNPLGTRWMGLSTPGVGIHDTPDGGSIGYSLSHGCIQMRLSQAEWLFNHVTVGTPVYIVAS